MVVLGGGGDLHSTDTVVPWSCGKLLVFSVLGMNLIELPLFSTTPETLLPNFLNFRVIKSSSSSTSSVSTLIGDCLFPPHDEPSNVGHSA